MIISASRYFHIAKLTMCYVYLQEVQELIKGILKSYNLKWSLQTQQVLQPTPT